MDWNHVETVVVPINLEDADDRSLRTALQAASTSEGVHAVYVLPELEPSLMVQIDTETRRANARRALEAWLGERGIDGVTPVVLVGRPARAIVDHAVSTGADLLILEARPHGLVERAMIGSVAERVARHAPCPVLLMQRPPA